MMRRFAFAAAAAVMASLALLPAQAHADTASVLCTNTSYVDGTNNKTKGSNYGSATDLDIKSTVQYAYLECVVPAGTVPVGATNVAGTLNVFSRSVNTAHTVRLHNVATGWVESTLTWNNRPAFDAAVLSSAAGDVVPGSGEWVTLPASTVTGDGTFRFALDTTATTTQAYASDDYTTDTARRPRLDLTWNAAVVAPVASFTATPATGDAPLTVQFTDTSTGSPTGWGWDFGDGATSAVQNPSHTYSAAGTYTVTLTASNAGGSDVSDPQTITVTSPPPPGPNWLVAFDDQFNDGIVPSHWTRYSGPNGSNDPNDCSDPNLWSVSNGELVLPFRYQMTGLCGATWYNASGMDNSALGKSVDQKIVIRWRMDGTVLPHFVVPMRWDADPNFTWDKLEQDWCERPSGYTTFTGCQTHNHYQSTSPCCIDSPIYNVDLTQWHTWEFTTYQHRLTTVIDGVVVWDYQGDNTTVPNGLRRDVLQVECKSLCPADTTLTAQAEVDYMTTYYPG